MVKNCKEGFLAPCFCNLFVILFFSDVFNDDVVVLGNELHGFYEGEVFLLHNESDSITTSVATETMKQILDR